MLKQEAYDFPWMFSQVSHGICCMLLLITEDLSPVACTVDRMGRFSWADALGTIRKNTFSSAVAEQLWTYECRHKNLYALNLSFYLIPVAASVTLESCHFP